MLYRYLFWSKEESHFGLPEFRRTRAPCITFEEADIESVSSPSWDDGNKKVSTPPLTCIPAYAQATPQASLPHTPRNTQHQRMPLGGPFFRDAKPCGNSAKRSPCQFQYVKLPLPHFGPSAARPPSPWSQAKMIFATGWASVAATYRDLERTETAEKIKEGTVNLVDRSMDGLSKVCVSAEGLERTYYFVCTCVFLQARCVQWWTAAVWKLEAFFYLGLKGFL